MKVVLLGAEDWEVLYVEGEKVEENHSLNLNYTLEEIFKRYDKDFVETGNPAISYQHFYFEPESDEEREEWEMGIYYEPKLKDVDPHLRQGISV